MSENQPESLSGKKVEDVEVVALSNNIAMSISIIFDDGTVLNLNGKEVPMYGGAVQWSIITPEQRGLGD